MGSLNRHEARSDTKQKPLHYSLLIRWSSEDDAYVATSEEFPGLSAFGNTYEESACEAQVAMRLFLDQYKEDKTPASEPKVVK
jgi:predicted RNase H-like HicB family nuclease